MVYQYIGYNDQGTMVKGKLTAPSEEAAVGLLDYAGYHVVQLKPFVPFLQLEKLLSGLSVIQNPEIILLYRQLALLLESGIGIIAALELLQAQVANKLLRKLLGEVISDLRSGKPLSVALGRHPEVFPPVSQRSIQIGEQSGNLETTLKQLADYLEKEQNNTKNLKNALRLPAITAVVALIVCAVLMVFALPAFADLYKSLGVQLPAITVAFMSLGVLLKAYGLFAILAVAVAAAGFCLYIKTPEGKYRLDRFTLKMPLLGRVVHLNELARCCRSMSLLYGSGLPLTEIMPMVIKCTTNSVLIRALVGVQGDMVKGEGLSGPMGKHTIFMPMMVQMVKVGEETGNLDHTLLSVAKTYETEAEDRTKSLVSMIQPTMTLAIGAVIGLIALSLTSAMYSIYGQGV